MSALLSSIHLTDPYLLPRCPGLCEDTPGRHRRGRPACPATVSGGFKPSRHLHLDQEHRHHRNSWPLNSPQLQPLQLHSWPVHLSHSTVASPTSLSPVLHSPACPNGVPRYFPWQRPKSCSLRCSVRMRQCHQCKLCCGPQMEMRYCQEAYK